LVVARRRQNRPVIQREALPGRKKSAISGAEQIKALFLSLTLWTGKLILPFWSELPGRVR